MIGSGEEDEADWNTGMSKRVDKHCYLDREAEQRAPHEIREPEFGSHREERTRHDRVPNRREGCRREAQLGVQQQCQEIREGIEQQQQGQHAQAVSRRGGDVGVRERRR